MSPTPLRSPVLLAVFLMAMGSALAVSPPTNVIAEDTPSDSGRSITIRWDLSTDDGQGTGTVTGYEVFKAGPPAGSDPAAARAWAGPPDPGSFQSVGTASGGQSSYKDLSVRDGLHYFYRVAAITASGDRAEGPVAGPASSYPQWIDRGKLWILFWSVMIAVCIILFIETARRGRKMFVRPIAGLEAINEAIGRATEMGRTIVYVAGTQDMNDIQTVAGVTILGYVAKTVAEYDTQIVVPTSRSLVMTTARETVKASYLSAGRPDSYREDNIYYTTDEQFGYVAAVNGLMIRSKPATCFYMGAFFAESLILAETGNSIGAIQIAGTAQPAQLPFFVAACDYTLIGEELFAASAYLSGEPKQLGSLKGQDVGKAIAIGAIVFGSILATAAVLAGDASMLSQLNGALVAIFSST